MENHRDFQVSLHRVKKSCKILKVKRVIERNIFQDLSRLCLHDLALRSLLKSCMNFCNILNKISCKKGTFLTRFCFKNLGLAKSKKQKIKRAKIN